MKVFLSNGIRRFLKITTHVVVASVLIIILIFSKCNKTTAKLDEYKGTTISDNSIDALLNKIKGDEYE